MDRVDSLDLDQAENILDETDAKLRNNDSHINPADIVDLVYENSPKKKRKKKKMIKISKKYKDDETNSSAGSDKRSIEPIQRRPKTK